MNDIEERLRIKSELEKTVRLVDNKWYVGNVAVSKKIVDVVLVAVGKSPESVNFMEQLRVVDYIDCVLEVIGNKE